jgi:hypothetical protein
MKQRGGSRKGAGRKKISEEGRTIRARVGPVHEQALMLAGNGSLSEGIRRLAEKHWRLVHGDKPKQSHPVFNGHGSFVRPSESKPDVPRGNAKVSESKADEELPRDSVG